MLKDKKIKPFLKWAGGKTGELKMIEGYLPEKVDNYYEPFIGGGAVWLATNLAFRCAYVNDYSQELISFYNAVKNGDSEFFEVLYSFVASWERIEEYCNANEDLLVSIYLEYKRDLIDFDFLLNRITELIDESDIFFNVKHNEVKTSQKKHFVKYIVDKYKRTKNNEIKKGDMNKCDYIMNIETGFKAGLYMFSRSLYNAHRKKTDYINSSVYSALYFIIREYCYSSMFRFNGSGEFNVPYGGNSYNKKSLVPKIEHFKKVEVIEHLNKTSIYNGDFEDFIRTMDIKDDDFVFLDPPYDSEFSDYDENVFDKAEQERLAKLFINDVKGKWMMVIKKTDFIYSLYDKDGIYIYPFDKKYSVSFMDRNVQDVVHIIITNYEVKNK